jgi:hypothetical protein
VKFEATKKYLVKEENITDERTLQDQIVCTILANKKIIKVFNNPDSLLIFLIFDKNLISRFRC